MSPTRPRRAAVLSSMSATLRLVAVVAASLLLQRRCFLSDADGPAGYTWISFVWTRESPERLGSGAAVVDRKSGHWLLRWRLQTGSCFDCFTGPNFLQG